MAKRSASENTNITKVTPNMSLPTAPTFMQGATDLGIEELSRWVVPPRIKLIQAQANPELLEKYAPGDVIATGLDCIIAEPERDSKGKILSPAVFCFTPIYFFPEWCCWNDMNLRGKEPAIIERSFDPQSPVAMKAKTKFNKKVPHPTVDGASVSFAEHMNFVVAIHNNPAVEDTLMIMTFLRGSHAQGTALAGKIKARRAPMWGCIFDAVIDLKTNQKGNFYVPFCDNTTHDIGPWVTDEEVFKKFETFHDEMKKAHLERRIVVDYEDDAGSDEDPASTPASSEM